MGFQPFWSVSIIAEVDANQRAFITPGVAYGSDLPDGLPGSTIFTTGVTAVKATVLVKSVDTE